MTIIKFTDFKKLKRNSIKMEKNLYIDASHRMKLVLFSNPENSIEEYEFEDKNNLNFKQYLSRHHK